MSGQKTFTITLPLITEPWHEDFINKRIDMCHRLYNQCVKKTKNAYVEMIKTKEYRAIKEELQEIYKEKKLKEAEEKAVEEKEGKDGNKKKEKDKKDKKTPREEELYKQLNNLKMKYKITQFGMMELSSKLAKKAGYNVDLSYDETSRVGKRLWSAWHKFLYENGNDVHFSKYYNYNSVEGKTNKGGIKLLYTDKGNWDGYRWAVSWKGVLIPVKIDENNKYEQEVLENDIAYNRILRKTVNGKQKFYVQAVLKGTPVQKTNEETGEVIHKLGHGTVGLYITLTKVTATTENEVREYQLAEGIQPIKDQVAEIQRKMDNSKRATNPDKYNENGTLKTSGGTKTKWVYSNHYKELRKEKASLQAKEARMRKQSHEILANEIISLGDDFIINKQDFKSYQERKEEVKEDGTVIRRKRFGSVIADRAPSEFVNILERKLKLYYDIDLVKPDDI